MYWSELTTGIYPWDVADEKIETILDNLQSIGVNSTYMVALMHPEKRPFRHPYYDHNPKRKRYLAEDSRCYWLVDDKEYESSLIKPLMSERDFLKGVDWLDIMTEGLRKRGMKVGAEISHTPLDGDRGASEFSAHVQRDIYGQVPGYPHYFTRGHLCWNSPQAKEYVYCLARDLTRNHDVDFIQTCSWPFGSGDYSEHEFLGVLLGGCFCEHCASQAKSQGIDWDNLVSQIKKITDTLTHRTLECEEDLKQLKKGTTTPVMFMLETPEIFQWLKFRSDSLTEYYKGLSEAIHSVNKNIEFRINTCWREPEMYGINIKDINPYVDSIRMMDYLEQDGYSDDLLEKKAAWLADVRRQAGESKTIIGGIAPRGKATPQLIKNSIKTLAHEGIDGLSFGFYDCATMENLKAIGEGIKEAGVIIK